MSRSKLETDLAFAMRAIGIPEWVEELHFDWCCEHTKRAHRRGWHCTECYCHVFNGVSREHGECAHEYAKGRKWAFDFAWPERMIAVEVEGGVYSGGRHVRGKGYEGDAEKYREAARKGWDVIRVTGRQVRSGEALNIIEAALRAPVTVEELI